MTRGALATGLLLAGAILLAVGLRGRLVEGLLFHPSPGAGPVSSRLGVAVEEIFLESSDGVRVHAYWLPHEGARRAILFLHGNAGNAWHRLDNAAVLAEQGASVLLLDYRGYGRSEGRPSESGLYRDARAAFAHLIDERGIPARRIVVFGRSLGGAVAVDLAHDRDPDAQPAGLILESTFPSVSAVARELGGPVLAALVGDRFASDAKIARVRAPMLFFHGDRDRVIPHALGQRLFERATGPKEFETLRGAGHDDTLRIGGRAYLQRIRAFLDRVTCESPSAES